MSKGGITLDLFSKQIRNPVAWESEAALQQQMSNGTLIGGSIPGDADAASRIAVLEEFEQREGAVFFAEKLWLLHGQDAVYADWVSSKMLALGDSDCLIPKFNAMVGKIPGSVLPAIPCQETAKRFNRPRNNFEYWIVEGKDSPKREVLVTRAFHLLFNIGHFAAIVYEGMKSYVEEKLLNSLEFSIADIRTLGDESINDIWVLSVADPYYTSHPIFRRDKVCSDLDQWPQLDRESAEKILQQSDSRAAGSEVFWI